MVHPDCAYLDFINFEDGTRFVSFPCDGPDAVPELGLRYNVSLNTCDPLFYLYTEQILKLKYSGWMSPKNGKGCYVPNG
jgi:hypothetical protein